MPTMRSIRRLRLLNPVVVYRAIRAFTRGEGRVENWSDDLGARDPAVIAPLIDFFDALGRYYFRLRIEGVDHVPAAGPALLVGNHNGGILPFDSAFTLSAIWRRFGAERAVYSLGHDLLGQDAALRGVARAVGVLRAAPEQAALALSAGHLVLVYPGSANDSWRPWRERGRVDLGGRLGFLRVALREGVPVVPVVSAGTHEQFVVLARGARVARRLDLGRRLRAHAFPIVLALPWGLTLGFLPYLPLPAQTTVRFGAPLSWPALGPDAADDETVLRRCYAEVEDAMNAELATLHRGRVPFLGRVRR